MLSQHMVSKKYSLVLIILSCELLIMQFFLQTAMRGVEGPMGLTGPSGPEGEIGPEGPKGEQGEQGEPVRKLLFKRKLKLEVQNTVL